MCELFGYSGNKSADMGPYLKELMSHSHDHPHGWGMVAFHGNMVNLEKEPKQAWVSDYLSARLRYPIEVTGMIAHIRQATRGGMEYINCHPFSMWDRSNRTWVLAHNGTIFESSFLDHYREVQIGGTDSERVLCYLIESINKELELCPKGLNADARFAIVDRVVGSLAEHNKLNLLIYDGELLYVHTNMAGTLYRSQRSEGVLFATVPLDDGDWQPQPMMQLQAYRDGQLVFTGSKHNYEYRKPDSLDDSMSWMGL